MPRSIKKEGAYVICPHCGEKSTVSSETGVRRTCEKCGKDFIPEDIEVETSKARRLENEMERRRKREIEEAGQDGDY